MTVADPFAYLVILLAALAGAWWLSRRAGFQPEQVVWEPCDCPPPLEQWEPGFDFADGSAGVVPCSDEHLLDVAYASGVVQ